MELPDWWDWELEISSHCLKRMSERSFNETDLRTLVDFCLAKGTMMQQSYLEVTFRNGIPLAAYYYLPRLAGEKCVRVEKHCAGLLVDLAADGHPPRR